jgi:activating signal cointegrator 1
MRALSLYQPWASLMAVGAKRIETRSWPTSYRGLVAIHAAKKWDAELRATALRKRFAACLSEGLPIEVEFNPDDLPRGCFVAVGHLHRVLSTTEHAIAIPQQDTDEFWFGDYSEGRFMWVFDEVWKLSSPVYARGQMGLWTLDEGQEEVIRALLPDGVEERYA